MSTRGEGQVPLEKTVYVLGAGFSIPAGAPSQAEIMGAIFPKRWRSESRRKTRTKLAKFLTEDLAIAEDKFPKVALEDIYTPIDRCLASNTSFRNHTSERLSALRQALGEEISLAIAQSIERNGNSARYIRRFAKYLVELAAPRAKLAANADTAKQAKKYDPVAIISLNWDIILDNALHTALRTNHRGKGDYDPFGVVDYCCYVSSLGEHDTRIRAGLFSLGCRGFNVKLLKLHGSMNWLQCPNCQRLYVGFGKKLDLLGKLGHARCRHCQRCNIESALQGALVMPTFLKDLSNFQIKLVWQNAGLELMEARRLVFIGYSLPYADFEFRQLLSRMVQPGVAIEVVLFKRPGEDPSYEAERQRYEQFFGQRKLTFHDTGVVDYIERLPAP